MRRQVSLPAAGEPGASLPRIRLQVRDAGARPRRPTGLRALKRAVETLRGGPRDHQDALRRTRSVASEGPSQRERARDRERTRRQKACRAFGNFGSKLPRPLVFHLPPPGSSVQGSLLRNCSAQRSAPPLRARRRRPLRTAERTPSVGSLGALLRERLPSAPRLSRRGPVPAPPAAAAPAAPAPEEHGDTPVFGSSFVGQVGRSLADGSGYSRSLAATQRQDLRGSWSYGDTRTA